MQRPGFACLMWWLGITASLAFGRIPASFESTYSLDFKVEYYPHSLLESDGLIVPQSSSAECYLWNHDTAQFPPVEFDDRMCIDRPEYSPDGRLLVWHGLLFEPGTRGLAKSLASSRRPGSYHWLLNLNYSPTLIKHSLGGSLTPLRKHNRSLWHLYRLSVRLDFGSSSAHGVYTRWDLVVNCAPTLTWENGT